MVRLAPLAAHQGGQRPRRLLPVLPLGVQTAWDGCGKQLDDQSEDEGHDDGLESVVQLAPLFVLAQVGPPPGAAEVEVREEGPGAPTEDADPHGREQEEGVVELEQVDGVEDGPPVVDVGERHLMAQLPALEVGVEAPRGEDGHQAAEEDAVGGVVVPPADDLLHHEQEPPDRGPEGRGHAGGDPPGDEVHLQRLALRQALRP
mmetsp:Transcript_21551/g.38694  ORF Transcript_21551/g.38694 Transcript_21551/m.38694 type:complete len:203 (+) Transcript_21551:2-610(+)